MARRAVPIAIPVWAAWSESEVSICWLTDHATDCTVLPRVVPADGRYFTHLCRLADGGLMLRSGGSDYTRVEVFANDRTITPLPLPVELAARPPYDVVGLDDGTWVWIDARSAELVTWSTDGGVNERTLPPGFDATDVAGTRTEMWLCGSAAARAGRAAGTRAALAVSRDGGLSWSVDTRTHGGLGMAWRAALGGAIKAYRRIYVSADWLVAVAELGELGGEDSYVYIRLPTGRWRSVLLAQDSVRSVTPGPDAGIWIVSHRGRLIHLDPRGRQDESDLGLRVRQVLGEADLATERTARVEILGGAADGLDLLIIASLRARPGIRLGEAVVIVSPVGDRLIQWQSPPAAEVVSVGWLSR